MTVETLSKYIYVVETSVSLFLYMVLVNNLFQWNVVFGGCGLRKVYIYFNVSLGRPRCHVLVWLLFSSCWYP